MITNYYESLLSMKHLIRASYLDWRNLALTPALSPGRGRIILSEFETTNGNISS